MDETPKSHIGRMLQGFDAGLNLAVEETLARGEGILPRADVTYIVRQIKSLDAHTAAVQSVLARIDKFWKDHVEDPEERERRKNMQLKYLVVELAALACDHKRRSKAGVDIGDPDLQRRARNATIVG